jgi:hypothetical protein
LLNAGLRLFGLNAVHPGPMAMAGTKVGGKAKSDIAVRFVGRGSCARNLDI